MCARAHSGPRVRRPGLSIVNRCPFWEIEREVSRRNRDIDFAFGGHFKGTETIFAAHPLWHPNPLGGLREFFDFL